MKAYAADTSDAVSSVEEVKVEYAAFRKQFPTNKTDLETFAAQMDQVQKVDRRFAVYKGNPKLYPTMPLTWVEAKYRAFKRANKESKQTITEFAWQADCEEGGLRYLEGYREHYGALVLLYDFMGLDQMPFPRVFIIEKRAGYIKFLQASGNTITHSGRYSLLD